MLGMPRGNSRRPIEDMLFARHLRKNHHPGQEQIDVQPLIDRVRSLRQRNQTQNDQEQSPAANPIRLADFARSATAYTKC